MLATYPRSYDTGKQYFQLEHYLKLLERKPRAVGQALPVRQTNLPSVFANYHREALLYDPETGDKLFVSVLLLLKQYPAILLSNVLDKALTGGIVAIDTIQAYAENALRNSIRKDPVRQVPTSHSIDNPTIAPPQINRYRQLSQGGMSA